MACATLPRTVVPVCAWDPNVVCRAPAIASLLGARNLMWEHENVCPAKTDLSFRSCYLFVGMRVGVHVYTYRKWETR